MNTLGICTSYKNFAQLNYEKHSLYIEGSKTYDEVLLIDTRAVTYKLIRGHERPTITHNGINISNLSSLHIRSTKQRETSTAILAHSLVLCGCDVLDPLERFSVGYASKLLTELKRFEKGIGIDSFFAFNFENANRLLDQLESHEFFPLITKPIAGRFGRGVELIENVSNAVSYADKFFRDQENKDTLYFSNTL